MRLSRDITRYGFLIEVDGTPHAALAVGLSVVSPFGTRAGAAASPFYQALSFGLPLLRSVDDLSFDIPVEPYGWCVEEAAGGALSISRPDGELLVSDLDLALPPDWLEAARSAGSVMLVVSHVLPGGDDPLGALALEAARGTVCAGLVSFGVPRFRVDRFTAWNPLGDLMDLAVDVFERIISLNEAKRRACVMAEDAMFGATFQDALDVQLRQHLDHPGLYEVQHAYWRLIAEVADACGAEESWRAAGRLTVEAAAAVVAERCDRAVFEDAEAVSARLIARESGPEDLAAALTVGARLRLASRGPMEFAADHYAHVVRTTWTARAEAELYRTWFRDEEPFQMEAQRLIEEAARLLRRALELDGVTPQPSLWATVAQIYRDENGVWPDAAAAALSALLGSPTLTEPHVAWFLLRMVDGIPPDTVGELHEAVFGTSLEDSVAAWGKTVMAKVLSQAINLAREQADQPLLRTALEWADRLEVRWDPAHRRQLIEARAHVLPDDPTSCPNPAMSVPQDWTPAQRSAALLHAAAHARDRRQPALGLALLRQVGHDMSRELRLLSADLHFQAAIAGEPGPGPLPFPWGYYTYAALGYASLGFTDLARACLAPVAQQVGNLRGEELRSALYAIIVDLPNFSGSGAPELAEVLRDLTHTAVWQTVVESETLPVGLMLGLHHVAKGPELGAWWRIDGPIALPGHIQHFTARLLDLDSPAGSGEPQNLLDDIDADSRPSGRNDMEIARNLRWRISSLIDAELGRRSTPLVDDQHLWARVRDLIDDRTVLLTWFLPRSVRGAAVLLAVTRQRSELFIRLGDGEDEMDARHPVAYEVAAIREEIQHDPLFADVTPEAARLLRLAGSLLGGDDRWAAWRTQGKDRLLIWPHGAMHYLPIPLCRVDGRPIADDWTVTTIAGLESLTSPEGPTRQRRTTILASSAGGMPFGLHDEPALEEHAQTVAGAVGTEAVIGAAATRARLLTELSTSDIIHIAVHGTMDQDAPWLHCLYLTPDSDDDGRVFAQDFLEVDLRGVRLVTLAACESALGRFDYGDNVRGIPSALITAGAQAVVGCLWPVRPAPAGYFYQHLHHQIAAGADTVKAFREAQLATRAGHPKYRDWGSFTYLHGRNKGSQRD